MILSICLPLLEYQYFTTVEELHRKWHIKHGNVEMDKKICYLLNKQALRQVIKEVPHSECCNSISSIAEKSNIKIEYIGTVVLKGDKITLVTKNQKQYHKIEFREIENDDEPISNLQLSDNVWSIVTDISDEAKISKYNIVENKSLIKGAKIICVCSFTIAQSPNNTEFILAKIKAKNLVFYLSENFDFSKIPVKLLRKVIKKSIIVLGNYSEMELLRKQLYQDRYTSVDEMVIHKSKKRRIFILTNLKYKITYARKGVLICIPFEDKQTANSLTQCVDEHFVAGFVSQYYKDSNNIEKCVHVGLEWAEDYYTMQFLL